jgi:predicted Rossmann fold flavoprotein
MKQQYNTIVIGGGAAGFFAALSSKSCSPESSVLILEKSSSLLSKVRISGGGRCNVTHACFDPRELVKNYPRGGKALIGPFTRFQPRDTMDWFSSRGVDLKIEQDGRVFPVSDSSQTIIDCLMKEANKLHVEIRLKQNITQIVHTESIFVIHLDSGECLTCDRLIMATGSHPFGFGLAKSFGHTIQDPIPSLFTFNVPTSPLKDLAGIALANVKISIRNTQLEQTGPILITHWGFSGPAALKLSAWGARLLHDKKYRVELCINWIPQFSQAKAAEVLFACRNKNPSQTLIASNPFELPKNLWKRFVELSSIDPKKRYSEIGNQVLTQLAERLINDVYFTDGKTTNKEEFVTCGGGSLDEIDFKKMESRLCKGLHFVGEILDIDGVTGGFNFQNAWTGGWLAGNAMAS